MRRLLIADDAPAVALVLERYLRRAGYAVEICRDGAAALERLKAGDPPDVVIADLLMPVLGGRELVMAMRADQALRDIPVILLSGAVYHAPEFPPPDSFQALLQKPFELPELCSAIERVVQRQTGEPRVNAT